MVNVYCQGIKLSQFLNVSGLDVLASQKRKENEDKEPEKKKSKSDKDENSQRIKDRSVSLG